MRSQVKVLCETFLTLYYFVVLAVAKNGYIRLSHIFYYNTNKDFIINEWTVFVSFVP